MKKIELTIAPDYVPSWTIVDAIRELFQNALDQEATSADNKASWSYADGTFKICNKKSVLTTNTLLLGASSKRDDAKTIGQFGEGYKIAALVLLRNDKQMTIYNYALREVWRPRFVKSRRFGTDILTFFVDKEYPWTQVPDNDLTIEVTGITDEEWNEKIVPSNLHLQNYGVEETTEYGEALKDEAQSGNVYVNGLFVRNYEPYKYGYNFKPGYLTLDRDRKLVSDFDLCWLASRFWLDNPKAIDLVVQGLVDVKYIASMTGCNWGMLRKEAFDKFILEYGDTAVPVVNQTEADRVPSTHKPIIVTETYKSLITSCLYYSEPSIQKITPVMRLREWADSHNEVLKQSLGDDALEELYSIVCELE